MFTRKIALTRAIERSIGWWLIAVLVAIPIIRWFQINTLDTSLATSYAYYSMIGRIAGLVGIVLFALNFILATRLRLLELLFGGLNRVYIAHHIVGGLALIALLIHPLALAMRYVPDQMEAAANFLLPFLQQPIDWPIAVGMISFIGLVVLLIITFFVRLPYQWWLLTHRFLGVAFLFGGIHVMLIPSDTSTDNFMRLYILTLAALGLAAFIYRSVLPRIFVRKENFTITQTHLLAENILRVDLAPIGRAISYKPGQFVFIRFKQPGIAYEYHPFTISSAPSTNGSGNLSLTIKSLGDFTASLRNLQAGTTAQVEGAFGQFIFSRSTHTRQIWVAGGIGITPFLSMANSIAREQQKTGKTYDITLFHAVRNESELVDSMILEKLSRTEDLAFQYIPYVDEGSNHITVSFVRSHVNGFDDTDIYICGPVHMMKSMQQQFVAAGVAKKYIYTEEFTLS